MQYAIDNIRTNASATSQYILVPGTDYSGITDWVADSEPALGKLIDPSQRLLFDVHKYFDNNGGNTGICADFDPGPFHRFAGAMSVLKSKGILTETGGSGNPGCNKSLNAELDFLESNSDVFFGWTAWGAGLSPTEATYLNPAGWDISTHDQSVNIVRDVLVPHMETKASATSSPPQKGASTRCIAQLTKGFLLPFAVILWFLD